MGERPVGGVLTAVLSGQGITVPHLGQYKVNLEKHITIQTGVKRRHDQTDSLVLQSNGLKILGG